MAAKFPAARDFSHHWRHFSVPGPSWTWHLKLVRHCTGNRDWCPLWTHHWCLCERQGSRWPQRSQALQSQRFFCCLSSNGGRHSVCLVYTLFWGSDVRFSPWVHSRGHSSTWICTRVCSNPRAQSCAGACLLAWSAMLFFSSAQICPGGIRLHCCCHQLHLLHLGGPRLHLGGLRSRLLCRGGLCCIGGLLLHCGDFCSCLPCCGGPQLCPGLLLHQLRLGVLFHWQGKSRQDQAEQDKMESNVCVFIYLPPYLPPSCGHFGLIFSISSNLKFKCFQL